MSETEIRQPMGFLHIGDGPILLDYTKHPLTQDSYGIDLHSEPVFVCSTESLDLTKGDVTEEKLADQVGMLTHIVVERIEHYCIPGELILYYETVQLRWDFKIVCKVYKR